MTAKTPAQVKALYQSGQNIFRRQSVECLLEHIKELEAYIMQDPRIQEIKRLEAERDRFAAMLGAEHAKQTSPPKGGDA